jgi:uncharacterized protein (DUF697 family)
MYHNNQPYRAPQYESNDEYNMESAPEMENAYNNGEFNYESGSGYELAPEFEIGQEMESDNEYGGNNETNDEYSQANEYSNYGEMEGGSVYRDEMEAELENVTNEQEFSNWVNEVVVRDHRNRNLRPVLGRPITRRAVRHLSAIASRTLPYLGARRGGWRGNSYNYNSGNWRRPGRPWRRYSGYRPWQDNYNNGQQPYPDPNMGQQPMYPGANANAPQQTNDQDGSFKNFVLDTLKNLSQQISLGNESLSALKNSVTSSAVNNFPSIVQPKGDAGPGAPPDGPPPAGEFGRGDYEYNNYEYNNMEAEGETTDSESGFSEEMEMELASELLAVKNEMELDHFFGSLLGKAVKAVSGLFNTGAGKKLKGVLQTVAKTALPLAGTAAGTYFGGPLGAAVGEKLGKSASDMFGLELEGLSNEDREFEVARAVVRFAGNAARQLSEGQNGNPPGDVRQAVMESAMRFAPGLLLRRGQQHHHRGFNGYGNNANEGDNGTWYRKGNKIIIENI